MGRRLMICMALVGLLVSFQLSAQQDPAADAEKPAARAYRVKLEEWKTMLRTLQKLRADFLQASPEEVTTIRKQWDEIMTLGDRLLPQLRETAKQALSSLPTRIVSLDAS